MPVVATGRAARVPRRREQPGTARHSDAGRRHCGRAVDHAYLVSARSSSTLVLQIVRPGRHGHSLDWPDKTIIIARRSLHSPGALADDAHPFRYALTVRDAHADARMVHHWLSNSLTRRCCRAHRAPRAMSTRRRDVRPCRVSTSSSSSRIAVSSLAPHRRESPLRSRTATRVKHSVLSIPTRHPLRSRTGTRVEPSVRWTATRVRPQLQVPRGDSCETHDCELRPGGRCGKNRRLTRPYDRRWRPRTRLRSAPHARLLLCARQLGEHSRSRPPMVAFHSELKGGDGAR
jgi:hypothetical protein